MTAAAPLGVLDAGVQLDPDPTRVIAALFLPGESTPGGSSRTEAVLARALADSATGTAETASAIMERFGDRHHAFAATLRANAAMVRRSDAEPLDPDQAIVVGAVFTAEVSVEGAALCNPSAVDHPDQRGLADGQLRVLLSMRAIGESHRSRIEFSEAIIGPGRAWAFERRVGPLRLAEVSEGEWTREHFLRSLEHGGRTDELARAIGQSLPERFASGLVERGVRSLRAPLLHQAEARAPQETIRTVAGSAYRVRFDDDSPVSARVLVPVADEERQGIEDARFVRFTDDDGRVELRATYTAFDGRSISSRLMTTTDAVEFSVHRLTGAPALNKGMALFPRRIGGELLALTRGDGESISIARSADGLHWGAEATLHGPSGLWDAVQSGNCGSPIETSAGWLVLTHGVGPMRVYSLGAILLDLDDPSIVLGVLREPLLQPVGASVDGYVPNVVYSCGAIVHDGVLWIPHGIADDRIRVVSVPLADLLLRLMTEQPSAGTGASAARTTADDRASIGDWVDEGGSTID